MLLMPPLIVNCQGSLATKLLGNTPFMTRLSYAQSPSTAVEFLGAWVEDSAQLYEAVGPRDAAGRPKKVSTSVRLPLLHRRPDCRLLGLCHESLLWQIYHLAVISVTDSTLSFPGDAVGDDKSSGQVGARVSGAPLLSSGAQQRRLRIPVRPGLQLLQDAGPACHQVLLALGIPFAAFEFT